MSILVILILWTWGLTPLAVNIVGTILMSLRIVLIIVKAWLKALEEQSKQRAELFKDLKL